MDIENIDSIGESQNYQKKLKNVDMSKTEHEIMIENNIFRIYDCGSYKFEFL